MQSVHSYNTVFLGESDLVISLVCMVTECQLPVPLQKRVDFYRVINSRVRSAVLGPVFRG
jgi:hypothetical protein